MTLHDGDRLVTIFGTPGDPLAGMMSGDSILKADGTVECGPKVNEQVAWGIQSSIAEGRTDGEIRLGGGVGRVTLYWRIVDVIQAVTGRTAKAPKPKPKAKKLPVRKPRT